MPGDMPPTVQAMLSDYSPQVATAPLADFIPAYEADIGRHLAGKCSLGPSLPQFSLTRVASRCCVDVYAGGQGLAGR